MPIFEYKAYVPGGATKTGVIDADTAREARSRLRRENVLVSTIHEVRGGRKVKKARKEKQYKPKKESKLLSTLRKVRSEPTGPSGRNLDLLTAITRQMGTLLAAGIPLAEALKAVIDQADKRQIETMFRSIRERITQGASLGDALAEHPQMFSPLYVNMVKAGEATGHVDQVLKRLADFLHRQRALQRKVVSALIYPAMMILLGVLVVAFLMSVVVPKISSMLEDQGQELPLPTRVLITISDGFQDYWLLGAAGIAVISFLIERTYRTPNGQLFIDKTLLKVPLIGELLRKAAVARFTRTLSTLLSSGVAAVRSLEITATVVGNRVIADATDHIRVRLMEGTDIATPLRSTNAFPSAVTYMVSVGEQSGQLEEMLDRIADAYDEEIEVVTERLTALLEPIMIVALAVVVGYIVVSIILPILQISAIV